MQRWIMHIDMDAFFASVEQLDHPAWRGLPVIVGGRERGVVSAASYEARVFGVRSAMPVGQARRLCPHGIFTQGRMARYRELSQCVMELLEGFSPLVEQASVDEAYLDATGLERLFGPVDAMGHQIKAAVRAHTGGLSCSIGIAPVKFLAKIASDVNKPDGLFMLQPHEIDGFLRVLPVGRIPGVGKRFEQELERLGVRTAGDARRFSDAFWRERYGKGGEHLSRLIRGEDTREIKPWTAPKSESSETTFAVDTCDRDFLVSCLYRHADRVGRHLRQQGLAGRVVVLKIKYADFRQITRQITLPEASCATQTIFETGRSLLETLNPREAVRLIGLGVSGFDKVARQMFLPFVDQAREQEELRRTRLDQVLDALGSKYGRGTVVRGRLYEAEAASARSAASAGVEGITGVAAPAGGAGSASTRSAEVAESAEYGAYGTNKRTGGKSMAKGDKKR